MRHFNSLLIVTLLAFAIGILGSTLWMVKRHDLILPIEKTVEHQSLLENKAVFQNPLQEPTFPRLWSEIKTKAGKIEVIEADYLNWQVKLNDKEILSHNNSLPPEFLEYIQAPISPFEEVIVLHRSEGTYCNGGTFWFLGLKENGTYEISKGTGECFAYLPVVTSGKDFVKVQIRSGYGNNHLEGEEYLNGGTWIFKNGKVYKYE